MLGRLVRQLFAVGAERHLRDAASLREAGRLDEALAICEQAVRNEPASAAARNALGLTLQAQSRLEEAAAQFRAALAAHAAYAPAHINLGHVLADTGDVDAAISHYRAALRLRPRDAGAHIALGMALDDRGAHAEAVAAFEEAHRLRPSDGLKIRAATLLPYCPASRQEIAAIRARFADSIEALSAGGARLEDPLREVGQTNFLLPYHGENDRELQVAVARMYERACPSLLYTAAHCRSPRRRDGAPLRVGFVSKFFSGQSVAIWFNRMIERLAALPALEVALLTLGHPVDEALRRACARHVPLPLDLAQARRRIAALELDVLVYADIGMEPQSYFLAFARLAPVQCAMLGHPVTTGIRNVDYFISSDLFESAEAQAHYSEKLVRLASLPVYMLPPQRPARPKARAELGLPEGRHLYVCPMMLHKFHPDFDAAMAAILRRDADAEIILFHDARHRHLHEKLSERLRRAMPDVADRVRFLPWASAEDLASIVLAAEAVIDCFHFGAGTTAFIVLGLGVPIVTLPGAYVRGRPAYGCYRKMGVMDCVARDVQEFVEIALRLGNDGAFREATRARVRETQSALFEDDAVVAEMARFLLDASPRQVA